MILQEVDADAPYISKITGFSPFLIRVSDIQLSKNTGGFGGFMAFLSANVFFQLIEILENKK